MEYYREQNGFPEENNPGTVYHTGNGFYTPYVEPLWKKEKRKIMGKIAVENADYVIVTSDNPRSENPNVIINEILEGIKKARCPYCRRHMRLGIKKCFG